MVSPLQYVMLPQRLGVATPLRHDGQIPVSDVRSGTASLGPTWEMETGSACRPPTTATTVAAAGCRGCIRVCDVPDLADSTARRRPQLTRVRTRASARPRVTEELSARVAAAGGADHSIQLLDVETGVVTAALMGHSKKVTALAFAGPGVLVSGGADGSVRSWHCSSGDDAKWVQQFSHTLPDTIVAVRTPADSSRRSAMPCVAVSAGVRHFPVLVRLLRETFICR